MVRQALQGVIAYKDSYKLIRELDLWGYFAIPLLICVLFFGLLGTLAWTLSGDISTWIMGFYPWESGEGVVSSIARFTSIIAIILFGMVFYKHLVLACSAPFMSPVSERVENHYGTQENKLPAGYETSNLKQLGRGVKLNMRNLIRELAATIPLFLLGFIPVVGLVFSILSFIVQAYYAGFGNMDYTLERHLSYSDSLKFIRHNRGLAVGNGLVFMGMLFIPVIGIIMVLPFSVTAASTVTLKTLKNSSSYHAR